MIKVIIWIHQSKMSIFIYKIGKNIMIYFINGRNRMKSLNINKIN